MTPTPDDLELILEGQIRILALTLRPNSVKGYRTAARRFLRYLRSAFPLVRRPGELRRDPHFIGWFTSLREQQPPLSNRMCWLYLLLLRRLLHDLAARGYAISPDSIRADDFPRLPRWLPRPLSPQDDQRLFSYLRSQQDLFSEALLLVRLTGMRIGECMGLSRDCLRQLGENQWALHIPLGKLHSERLVPADEEIRETVSRILVLTCDPPAQPFLLPHRGQGEALYHALRLALAKAAQKADCSCKVTPHQLRHTYATELIRLGVSLPAVMQLLGHKDIRMTLRYIQVTQADLQREFHAARRTDQNLHRVPVLAPSALSISLGPSAIRQAITAALHFLEMHRRQIEEVKIKAKLQRLQWRLLAIRKEADKLTNPEK
jgi:integrase